MKISCVCWYCFTASGKTWASSWNVYKWPPVFNQAECLAQQKQSCSMRENETGAEGNAEQALTDRTPPHRIWAWPWWCPSRIVDGGSGAGLFSSSSRRPTLRQATNSACLEGKVICARKAGDRVGFRDTYNIVQASPRHLSPSLTRSPGSWAENVGRGPRWVLPGQFTPVSALTTLTFSANSLSGPRS